MHLNCFKLVIRVVYRYNFNQVGDSPGRYRNLVCESKQYDQT